MTFAIGLFFRSLNMTSNAPAAAVYRLENGVLKIDGAANEQIEAIANFVRCTTAKTVSFAYDHNGLRTQKKIVEGSTTTIYDYTLHGKQITHLTKTVNGTKSSKMHFFYDAQGKPAMVKHGNNLCCYVHNLQGDIVGIIDGAGTLVIEYKYDAWGNHIRTVPEHGVGAINPLRNRSYMFDAGVGLYYLHIRYYHGDCSRFMSGDSLLNNRLLNGVYTCCLNSPITFFDSDGKDTNSVYLNVYNE